MTVSEYAVLKDMTIEEVKAISGLPYPSSNINKATMDILEAEVESEVAEYTELQLKVFGIDKLKKMFGE